MSVFRNHIYLRYYQLREALLSFITPTSAREGEIWYEATIQRPMFCNGIENVEFLESKIAYSKLQSAIVNTGNSGIVETNLFNYKIPANTIQNIGGRVKAEYYGNWVGNAITRRLRFYAGSTLIADTALIAGTTSIGWKASVEMVKTSSTNCYFNVNFYHNEITSRFYSGVFDTSLNQNFRITAQMDTGGATNTVLGNYYDILIRK